MFLDATLENDATLVGDADLAGFSVYALHFHVIASVANSIKLKYSSI